MASIKTKESTSSQHIEVIKKRLWKIKNGKIKFKSWNALKLKYVCLWI